MVERKQIALLFEFNDNWIGGAYYIINIVRALNVLSDEEKPALTIFYNSEASLIPITELNYPYINFIPFDSTFNVFEKIFDRLGLMLLKKYVIRKKLDKRAIKNLYPVNSWVDISNIEGFFYWIPDFQEKYLPHFFSKRDINQRKYFQQYLVKHKFPIVFSSFNALNDFNKFYPENKNRKEVLQFASLINEGYLNIDIKNLKEKFNIGVEYFISPNQFWQHKNQTIIIEAAKVLKERGVEFLIVFTGKEYDYRNPNYSLDLKKTISDNGLEENFRFLGFIDREEQLQLMKNSIAIIQPSLFEGWSTVVEDTKALNHVIVLSDLPLHREQISQNCLFFDPLDEIDLADKLLFAMRNNLASATFNNNEYQLDFAKKIISIFN